MVTPGGGLIVWQSLWRDGVTIRWWWWWGGREWWCLERDPQGKEHCHPCCPQVLWTMASTEVRAPQVRANAGPLFARRGKGWQWAFSGPETRTCLVSGMSHTKVECQLWAASLARFWDRNNAPAVRAILSSGGPSGIGANKNPEALGAFGPPQERGGSGDMVRGYRRSLSTQKGRNQDQVSC